MNSHPHAIVWMDSHEAHIFLFDASTIEKSVVRTANPFHKVHHKAGAIGSGHVHPPRKYFELIADTLNGVQAWLLIGPAGAKHEMARYARASVPALAHTMLGVESQDHPTDGELLAHAHRYFKAADKMRGNAPDHRQA